MREILFRGKWVDNGEWQCGSFILETHEIIKCLFDIDRRRYVHEFCEVDISTVGMYTGLTDKNGTKIFEGDIIEAYKFGEEKHINIITFKKGCFWFGNWHFTEFLDKFRMYEVIGSIHDNPELLEENNK